MPRVVKKGSKPAAQAKGPDALDLAAKGHQSEPATPKPYLKEVEGPFGDGVRASLVKRLSALKFPSSDAPPEGRDTSTNEKEDREEVKSPTAAPKAPEEGTEDEEEEDDGYLSDDPEERFDPVKVGEIAARAGFSITLLVPIKYEEEVPRTIDTVKGLLAIWRKFMSAHVLVTTKCQVLLPAWLSKKRYGRLQVTFQQASDANYVWCRRIQHKLLNGESIYLDWQHPENPIYIQERAANPDSIEVLLKSVPAAITSEMVYEYLVKTVLEKRGRTPFLSGAAFHRVVDPAVGALIESADDFVASYLSSCIPAARCAGEEDLTRPCCGADLHGGKPGGMALRPGGMWQGAWFQFYAGAGACGLMDNKHNLTLCEVNVNGLGSNGKRTAHAKWIRTIADVVVLTDTRIIEDHNFWTQLKPSSAAVVGNCERAGGVAVLSFNEEVKFTEVVTHPSGRLVGVTVSCSQTSFRLIAMYLPAQPCARGVFFRSCLPVFVQAQPTCAHLVVLGDLNLVEDPDLDKSSRSGSGNENQRLLGFWRTEDLRDAFRVLHPNRPEYTFRDRATKASTRIDRGLVSFSLLGLLADARHVKIPRGLSDHWFGIQLALAVAAPAEQGPGIWRMQARQARGSGVSTVSANILKKFENEEGMDLGKKLKLLSMGLREYSREERKRVRATVQHLEGVVERLRHKVMRYPEDRRAQNKLIKKEAHLEAYLQSCKDRMQVLAGIKVELRAKGGAKGGRGSLQVNLGVVPEEEVDWGAFSEGAKFSEADAELLGAVWTEEEVKQALESLPKGKSPGQDGLPAEFFIAHWELLKKHVMDFVGEFAEKAKLPESLSTSVTVLLHKKGPTDQLGNYRPITLLSAMYKVITKVMATRLKKVLGKVLSKEQHGFLPGKSLADADSVVADAVKAANSGGEDWLLLLVDFQKAYDTVSRSFLFRVMKELGMPENFIGWTRGLHPLYRATQREGLGIGPVGKEPLAYMGYADDTSFLLSGEAQLRRTVEVLDTFGKQSGLKVNCDKSVVVPLGSNRGEPVPADIPYKWSVQGEPERLLGGCG
ncbi:unnamed protein product [Closterium sp. Yama58-4]|nr:unnamed protein product [Closterium sp. Yama58-4]